LHVGIFERLLFSQKPLCHSPPWSGVGLGASKQTQENGPIETGTVNEQMIQIINADGNELHLRRISVKLHQPTRDGAKEILS
jgi:hypothetical protein